MALELPYVAGIFDGEGWITINKWAHPGRDYIRYQLLVGLTMTDRPLIEAFAAQFGGMCVCHKPPAKPTHRRCWTWRVASRAAVPFLTGILPWLTIKGDQARLVLEFQRHVTANASVFKYKPERRGELYAYREIVLAEMKRLHKISYDLVSTGPT
jgi:hypothetical protein